MRVTASVLGILCATVMVQATCKRGPRKSERLENAIDPDCVVTPDDLPEWVRKIPVSKLVEWLSSPNARVRSDGAADLAWYGCAAAPAIPALTRALKDGAEDVRYRAAEALGSIGARASSATPELLSLLEQKPSSQGWWKDGRSDVAKVLAALGPEAVRQTISRVIRKGYPEDVQGTTLAAFYTSWSAVVPALLTCLRDRKDPELRIWSASILGAMDTKAKSATARLFDQLIKGLARALTEDPEAEVRERSASALDELHKNWNHMTPVGRLIVEGREPMPTAARALVKALRDPNAKVRRAVVVALRYFYTADKALALPALERAKRDTDSNVRRTVQFTLEGIRDFEERERKRREEYRDAEPR